VPPPATQQQSIRKSGIGGGVSGGGARVVVRTKEDAELDRAKGARALLATETRRLEKEVRLYFSSTQKSTHTIRV
jgi:hypothetical protein